MLRISDILFESLFYDLNRNPKKFEKEISNQIILEAKRIGISKFEFFDLKSSKFKWTSLNGTKKLAFLENFQVSKFYNDEKGIKIENLWKEFIRLYRLIRRSLLSDHEIDSFQNDAKQWIRNFTEIYRKEDVSPYMHVFSMHTPQFIRDLKRQGLSLLLFSSSSIEKKNHHHVKLFYGKTCMGGGQKKEQSAIYDLLSFENRQLYYLKYNIPLLFKKKNIKIDLSENNQLQLE
jgi:hypothetical protein